MDSPANKAAIKPLGMLKALVYMLTAVAAFTLAYSFNAASFLIVVYLYCLISLARVKTSRQAFYFGLGVGMLAYPIQATFFWNIFGPTAIALWFVLAFWLGLFVMLSRLCLVNFKLPWGSLLIPFLWTGLEYFRSELYYLRFSWLNVGYTLFGSSFVGVYGVGFVVAMFAVLPLVVRRECLRRISLIEVLVLLGIIVIVLGLLLPALSTGKYKRPFPNFRIAGVQMEFPVANEINQALDKILVENEKQITTAENDKKLGRNSWNVFDLLHYTNLDLIVLSEYTLDGPPTEQLKNWCRDHQKFLVVGGKDITSGKDYYNTAFVISTNGEVVFKQAKSVPIQFFKDGLPAPEQKLWESPWGKIGICICHDLSYTRVTDELVRQGAQMLIVPTMDVTDWGKRQHELHARVAPVRAAEYGIPIFRVASSGISQGVTSRGIVKASASFPGEGEMIFFGANLNRKGSLPLDRLLAPFTVLITALVIIVLTAQTLRRKFSKKSQA